MSAKKNTSHKPGVLSLMTLRLVLLLVLATQLSGCLLNRVYAFKNQFCDYQANFSLLVQDEVTLQMHNPILLDTDVVWLLGAEPTARSNHGNWLEMLYLVEKDLPVAEPGYAVPLRLRFNRHKRLSAGVIDKNLSTIITPGLIEETVAHACNSQTSIVRKNVVFDLSGLDQADLPDQEQILEALGPPQQTLENGRLMIYRFRLQGAGPEVEKSYARVWLDPAEK